MPLQCIVRVLKVRLEGRVVDLKFWSCSWRNARGIPFGDFAETQGISYGVEDFSASKHRFSMCRLLWRCRPIVGQPQYVSADTLAVAS